MSPTPDSTLADPQQIIVELKRQLAECRAECDEALQQQTATAEVLEVINSSPGDLAPVFNAMLDEALQLCDAAFGTLWIYDGSHMHASAVRGAPPQYSEFLRLGPHRPSRIAHQGLLSGKRADHIADITTTEAYRAGDLLPRAVADLGGVHTLLAVPLRNDQRLIGIFSIYRQEVRPFSEKQIALLENFAAQAVIAMENARLLAELRQRTLDLTQGEAALRASEERYALAMRAINEGVYEWDVATSEMYFSPRVCELVGLEASELRRMEDWTDRIHPDDREAFRKAILSHFRGQTDRLQAEYRYRHVDGSWHWARQHGIALRNEAGRVYRVVGSTGDITDRKAAEEALREALEQQTATAEVLQVINASPGDLAPVFDAMLEKAMRLCEAAFGVLWMFDGGRLVPAGWRGVLTEFGKFLFEAVMVPGSGTAAHRFRGGERSVIQNLDLSDDEPYRAGDPLRRLLVDLGGARTAVHVPLVKEDTVLGIVTIYRQEVRAFSDKQIVLLQSFAAQAVIAMDNARLITETREALEQQTATAEILQIINSSQGDLAPVFDAMLDKALGLCGAAFGVLWTYDGERVHAAALRGVSPAFAEFLTRAPHPVGRENAHSRLLAGEPVVHIADVTEDAAYRSGDPTRRTLVELGGGRTLLAVPLRKDETFLGDFVIYRREVRPFSDKQIVLLQSFAAQAVIAMDNARLITETREALEQQTAVSDVLQVISRSTFDLHTVLETLAETAMRLCEAEMACMLRREGNVYRTLAAVGSSRELNTVAVRYGAFLETHPIVPGRGTLTSRVVLEGHPVQILDVAADPEYTLNEAITLGEIHTQLGVPLMREGAPVGVIILSRQRVEAFSDRQTQLVTTFADQAIIAMENARLIGELREARDAAEEALTELKTAQASLIHGEKMASLGQLTAGIAHEIKNPLNFVNNFAGLSVELLDELKDTASSVISALDGDKRAVIEETITMLSSNLEEIAERGRRADNIVTSMLEHSRGSSGERRSVDLNALIEEALNLAYHGGRAQDQSFNITLERDYADTISPIELVPQNITRVCLNLFGNGFYAATKHQKEASDTSFKPTLKVSTRDLGEAVEVHVRDNGIGIPPEIKDKLFQPFFTTKPAGEGTGLGLSISYDIITQQHGGTITVDSRPGEFTEFTVRLPRAYRATTAGAAS